MANNKSKGNEEIGQEALESITKQTDFIKRIDDLKVKEGKSRSGRPNKGNGNSFFFLTLNNK